ncbi:DUF397 domain-containing protein [Streptomyces sp. IBSBF 2390]|uniref:DUF397 domain-containing protein n=1 Tax=Streptomyces sp. IBSBF 2390 TaxID=2903533 RepID=UPI002FDC461A
MSASGDRGLLPVLGSLGSPSSCRHTGARDLTMLSLPRCGNGGEVVFPDPETGWKKSSTSGSENCVEVSFGSRILVRDSKNAEGPWIAVSCSAWGSFTGSFSTRYAAN